MELTQSNIKKILMDNLLYVVLLFMFVILIIISPAFLSWIVIRDILMQSSTRLIIALGCMFILIVAGADLSGGRVVGLAAVIAGSLAQSSTFYNKFFPMLPELPVIVPVLIAIGIGLLAGFLNGIIVAKLEVNPFIATLGIALVVYGFNCLYFNLPPNNSQPLGGFTKGFSALGGGATLGIPNIIIIAAVCTIIVYLFQRKTCLGKELFAVGGSKDAARVSGINVEKILVLAYSLAGALYGLGGVLEAARTGSATSTYGAGYEMDAIASCVVGGCSLMGGVGSVPGVVVGVLIFNVISYGLTFIGISSYWQNVFKGVIIICAVALDVRKNRKKN
ncbi:MAG: beta-methylgalactoside transporter [Spirochaetales bacterium]|nr:beta-methylgalactoside transporter [Spirochaetales bacterium]